MGTTIIIFLIYALTIEITSAQKMGPFDFTLKGVEECADIGEGKMKFSIKMYRLVQKSFSIDANLSMTVPFDDDTTIIFRLAHLTNGGWKSNFFVKDFPNGCTTLHLFVPDLLEKLRRYANLTTAQVRCPIRKGFYSINSFLLDFNIAGIPAFIYNKYRGTVVFTRGGNTIGCLQFYADVFPKRKNKSSRQRSLI